MSAASSIFAPTQVPTAPIQANIEQTIEEVLASFSKPEGLTPEERRGIIARYSAVLEGNFIYWMTGAYIAVRSEQARSIIMDNLHEEVRDAHPLMMRKFAV